MEQVENAASPESADLRDEREMFRLLFERAPIGIIMARPDGSFERVNPTMCDALGFSEAELLASSTDIVHPEEIDLDSSILAQLNDPSCRLLSVERRFIKKDGRVLHVLMKIAAQRREDGSLLRSIAQVLDLSKLRARDERIHRLSYSDPLTGLPNRRALIERLDYRMLKHPIESQRFAILFIDLDRFNVINDVLGHNIGDQVLLGVVQRMRLLCPEGDFLARVGGNEFALLIDAVDSDAVAALVKRIGKSLRRPFEIDDRSLSVGVSMGISYFPDDARSRSDLMRNADVALQRAKLDMSGFQRYVPGLNLYSEHWLTVESALQKSIEGQDFEIFVQPVVRANSRKTTFHEALLRWHYQGELKGPNAFVPIAETDGLIVQIDRLVSERAISAIASKSGGDVAKISLNLSAITLRDEKIVSHFRDLLDRFGVRGSSVLLEVTETAILFDLEHARDMLNQLRSMGIRVAIDDFGSGFASFSLLRNLRFDLLKIDRTLTAGIGRNTTDESILEGLIRLGHDLEVQVVAEGIESAAQCRWLESRGCDLLQGFHLGVPRPFC